VADRKHLHKIQFFWLFHGTAGPMPHHLSVKAHGKYKALGQLSVQELKRRGSFPWSSLPQKKVEKSADPPICLQPTRPKKQLRLEQVLFYSILYGI
jgi:hypothetical protein